MKQWFYQRFLPMWAKQTLLQEYRSLQNENQSLQCRVRELESHIRGMEKGCKRIIIQTGGKQ